MIVRVGDSFVDDGAGERVAVPRRLVRLRGVEPSVMSLATDDNGDRRTVRSLATGSVELLARL